MLESIGCEFKAGGRLVRWYLCLVAFGLPFLFGCQVMATENANFPNDLLVWLVLGFTPSAPSFLASLLSGIGLLLALCAYPRLRGVDKSIWWVLVWFGVFLAGLAGHLVTTERDYSLNWLLHFWGAGTYGLAVWWASRQDRGLLRCWCMSVGAGTALLCAYGYYQRFGGLASHLEEMKRQHLEEYGQPLPLRVEQKLMQLRVNSFFSDPNVFAAHLLVGLPPLFLALLGGRGLRGCRGLRLALLALATVLGLVMFLFTGSRGGLIGLLVGTCIGLWTLPWLQRQRWKWMLPVLAALLAFGIWWHASASLETGQVSTASVRFEYYRVAWEMFCDSPLTGKGLGEFFPYFVRMKSLGAEMTRDPHSFFMGGLAQCGLLGGLAVLLVLSFPFVQAFRRTCWRLPAAASAGDGWGLGQVLPLAGLAGWCIHSFFQFNELIPGTVYLLPVLPLLVLSERGVDGLSRPSGRWSACAVAVAAAVGLLGICWSASKIPCESRLQSISEDIHYLRREQLQLTRGAMPGDPEAAMVRLVSRRDRIKADLFDLAHRMALAPAPCNLLLQMLHEDVLGGGELPEESRQLLQETARMLWSRVPHRSNSCNELAWAYLACGEGEKAGEMLALAREWYPEDGMSYMLEAVPPGGLSALRLLEGLKARKRLDGSGAELIEVSAFPESNRQALQELFAGCRSHRFVLVTEQDGGEIR